MSVFYRGKRVVITHETFDAVCVARCRYAIADLTDVHIVRVEPEVNAASRVLGISGLGIALLVIPVIGRASALLAGVTMVVLVVAAALRVRSRPPVRWQLVATYEGVSTVLFSSTDGTEFEQVCRGLLRSLEARNDSRP